MSYSVSVIVPAYKEEEFIEQVLIETISEFKKNNFDLAIKKAKGKYITFLDVDDLWHTKKIKEQVNFLRPAYQRPALLVSFGICGNTNHRLVYLKVHLSLIATKQYNNLLQ